MDLGAGRSFEIVLENGSFDCADILERNPGADSGVFTIYPHGERHYVFCDMRTDLGGWTVRTCKCFLYLLSYFLDFRLSSYFSVWLKINMQGRH